MASALQKNGTAWENFQHFSNTDQHAFIAQVDDGKPTETKERRIERAVELAAQNLAAYDGDGKRRL